MSRKTANDRFFFNPPPPPSSKRPFQSGKIFQHFEGPFFEVALVSLLGLVNCFSITEESTGTSKTKLTWNTRYYIKLLKGKQFLLKHTSH